MPFISKITLNGKVYDIKASGESSPVLGVKGEKEETYRTGYVNITKENLGLNYVPNFKPVSTEANQGLSDTEKQNARDNIGALSSANKGSAGGVAELDGSGKVPSSQLPSFVDDVLEFISRSAFPLRGESGKIYVATDTNKTYRWSGSTYVIIGSDLALGETSSTAYRGDRGKIAYDHSQIRSGNPHNVTKTEIGLSNVPNVSTNNQTPSYVPASTLTPLSSGEKLTTAFGKIAKAVSELINHILDKANPHNVTVDQIGAATADHTHALTIQTESGTSTIDLAADTVYKITAGGQELVFKTPPDNAGTGGITRLSTGAGLTGGDITTSGTIKAKLKSESLSSLDSESMGSTASRQYAVGLDKNGNLSVNVPWNNTTYSVSKTSIGSASAGSSISTDDITAWNAGRMTTLSVSGTTLVVSNGTSPSLSYTERSVPNVSITQKSVVSSITTN